MRYLFALVPPEKERSPFIQVSQNLFGSLHDGYLLSEENSLPHITICAFLCEDFEKIEKLREDLRRSPIDPCPVRILRYCQKLCFGH